MGVTASSGAAAAWHLKVTRKNTFISHPNGCCPQHGWMVYIKHLLVSVRLKYQMGSHFPHLIIQSKLIICWTCRKKEGNRFFKCHVFHTIINNLLHCNLPDIQSHLTLSLLSQPSDLLHFSRHFTPQLSSLYFLMCSTVAFTFYYLRQWVHLGCVHPSFQIINQRRSAFPSPDLWRTTTAQTWIKATSQYRFCITGCSLHKKQTKKKVVQWSIKVYFAL